MPFENSHYLIIKPTDYLPYLPALADMLPSLLGNWVTYKKEIHRESRFAICQYKITHHNNQFELVYDAEKSKITANEKKTHTNPELLQCEDIRQVLYQFLVDINDPLLTRVEVKLIQTDVFPFEFNPHRDSQFRRLRHIKYLATVIVSCEDISGGNMQLFHSAGDQVGPFHVIEELPANVGAGYIVDETPQVVFHGMRTATAIGEGAHRGALLLRFFN